jgi:hypothetical protein
MHKFEKRGIALPLSMFQAAPMQGNGAAERQAL